MMEFPKDLLKKLIITGLVAIACVFGYNLVVSDSGEIDLDPKEDDIETPIDTITQDTMISPGTGSGSGIFEPVDTL